MWEDSCGLHLAHQPLPNPSSPRTWCHAFQKVNSHFLPQSGQGHLAMLNQRGVGRWAVGGEGGKAPNSFLDLPPTLLLLVAHPTSLQDNLLLILLFSSFQNIHFLFPVLLNFSFSKNLSGELTMARRQGNVYFQHTTFNGEPASFNT